MELKEPTLIEKSQTILVGFSFFGDPFTLSAGWTEENEIGRLWKRFMSYFSQNPTAIKHIKATNVMYETHIYHEETPVTGEFEVFVGVEVEKLEDVPIETVVKLFPETTYAAFTLKGRQITSDWWKEIQDSWLPRLGYSGTYPYQFQCYDQRFKGLEPGALEQSVLEVHIPLKS